VDRFTCGNGQDNPGTLDLEEGENRLACNTL
jgi:hypothetical protein